MNNNLYPENGCTQVCDAHENGSSTWKETGIVVLNYNQLKETIKQCFFEVKEELNSSNNKVIEKKWIKSKDAAEILQCNVSTINRWKHSGLLTPKTIGGRDYFSMEEINQLNGVA